jgi:hypothetical protein
MLGLLAIIVGRIIWQIRPRMATCVLFWLIVSVDKYADRNILAHNKFEWLAIIGMLCNASVTLVNGGKMPVMGHRGTFISVWRKARRNDKLLFLCDRFKGFSIGDVLILGSIPLSVIFQLIHK